MVGDGAAGEADGAGGSGDDGMMPGEHHFGDRRRRRAMCRR